MNQCVEQLFDRNGTYPLVESDVFEEDSSFHEDIPAKPLVAVKVTKPSLNREQRFQRWKMKVLSSSFGSGPLKQQKHAIASVISMLAPNYPIMAEHKKKIERCSSARRCNSKYCGHCSNSKTRQGNRYNRADEVLRQGFCNFRGTKHGKYSSNYQVHNAQKMLEPFDDLPLRCLHGITVNLGFIPPNYNLREIVELYKKRLRECYLKLTDGSIVRGYLDFKLMYVDKATFMIPNAPKEAPYHSRDDHERVAMLHAHFIVFDPKKTPEGVRDVFASEFTGAKRVCVRPAWEDIYCADGTVHKGIGGYAEYASLQKVEIAGFDDNIAALIEFATIDDTWDGRQKRIAYGNRKVDTESLIDQSILNQHLGALKLRSSRSSRSGLFVSPNIRKKLQVLYATTCDIIEILVSNNKCCMLFHNTSGNSVSDVVTNVDHLLNNDGATLPLIDVPTIKTDDNTSKKILKIITNDCFYIKLLSNSSRQKKAVHVGNTRFFIGHIAQTTEKVEQMHPP